MTRGESGAGSTSERLLLRLGLVMLTCLAAFRAQALPNLTPYQPQGWTGKIVVATTPGSTSASAIDAEEIRSTDPIYLNWAVTNFGTTATSSRFFVAVLIDGIPWNGNAYFFDDPPLLANYFVTWTNKRLPALAAGIHSIRIVVDSTHVIDESNELDNVFTVAVEVGVKAGGRKGATVKAVGPSLPIPIGEHLGGSRGGLTLELDPGPYVCAIHEPCTWKDVIGVSGGSPPYHFSVGSFAAGAPPFGMTVNVSTGSVSGTPTVAGTYGFEVCVADLVNDTVCARTSIEVSDSGSNEYANWDCNNQPQCISTLGHDVGSAGPFCSEAACDAWRQDHFAGASCTSQPQYTIYYAPPPGTCSNYPN